MLHIYWPEKVLSIGMEMRLFFDGRACDHSRSSQPLAPAPIAALRWKRAQADERHGVDRDDLPPLSEGPPPLPERQAAAVHHRLPRG